jgi:hypothetical protein
VATGEEAVAVERGVAAGGDDVPFQQHQRLRWPGRVARGPGEVEQQLIS